MKSLCEHRILNVNGLLYKVESVQFYHLLYYFMGIANTDKVNMPYNFLLVYQDYHAKFIVLRPLIITSAKEVSRSLFEIFCLIDSPHILQSDNGREFKNINLATMIRDLWPECKIIHGNPDIPNHKGQWRELTKKLNV